MSVNSISKTYVIADALIEMQSEMESVHECITKLQNTSKSFETCIGLFSYSNETLSGVFGSDKIKQAFLYVKRVLVDFQERNNVFNTNDRLLETIVKRMKAFVQQIKQMKDTPTDDYLKSVEVCCYDNKDFLEYLNNLNSFVTSLVKSSFADSSEKELQVPVSTLGYIIDKSNFIKVESKQKPVIQYKYFEKYTMDDLINLTDQFIDLCQKLIVLHRCRDNVNRDVTAAIRSVNDVDRLLKDNKTIRKKCFPTIDKINKTISKSNIVLNGSALVMSGIKVMDIMLSDMWTNILTK